ncbi:MAG TPA: hypothetical protein DIS78_05805, partial [Lachnospiraceae bacterium]|nr:hypothetical protein [Lachnospiraceae bacterium]
QGWKARLEDKVGRQGWKTRLEDKVGRQDWKARLEGKIGRQDKKARQEDTKIGIEIKIQRDINAGFKCF